MWEIHLALANWLLGLTGRQEACKSAHQLPWPSHTGFSGILSVAKQHWWDPIRFSHFCHIFSLIFTSHLILFCGLIGCEDLGTVFIWRTDKGFSWCVTSFWIGIKKSTIWQPHICNWSGFRLFWYDTQHVTFAFLLLWHRSRYSLWKDGTGSSSSSS